MKPQPAAPSYLVELFDPKNGIPQGVDVCAKLAVAMQKVHAHLKSLSESSRVELSYDPQGHVEGVGFFNGVNEPISCITVYHLERDTDEPSIQGIIRALTLAEPARSEALTEIFKF